MAGKTLGELLQSLWWLRGVVAAISLISILDNLTDLSRLEYLALVHRVVLDWNVLMGWVGRLIGWLPFLPRVNVLQMNTITLFSMICLPIIFQKFAELKTADSLPKSTDFKSKAKLAYARFNEFYLLPIVFSIVCVFFAFSSAHEVDGTEEVLMFFLAACALFLTYQAIFQRQKFARAAYLFLTFLGTLELVYLLNTPIFADLLDAYVCARQTPALHCVSETVRVDAHLIQ